MLGVVVLAGLASAYACGESEPQSLGPTKSADESVVRSGLEGLLQADSYNVEVHVNGDDLYDGRRWRADYVREKGFRVLYFPGDPPCAYDIEDPSIVDEGCGYTEAVWFGGSVFARLCATDGSRCVEWLKSDADPPIFVPAVGPGYTYFPDFPLVALDLGTFDQVGAEGSSESTRFRGDVDTMEVLLETQRRMFRSHTTDTECEVGDKSLICRDDTWEFTAIRPMGAVGSQAELYVDVLPSEPPRIGQVEVRFPVASGSMVSVQFSYSMYNSVDFDVPSAN